eukprot:ctg_1921.g399
MLGADRSQRLRTENLLAMTGVDSAAAAPAEAGCGGGGVPADGAAGIRRRTHIHASRTGCDHATDCEARPAVGADRSATAAADRADARSGAGGAGVPPA